MKENFIARRENFDIVFSKTRDNRTPVILSKTKNKEEEFRFEFSPEERGFIIKFMRTDEAFLNYIGTIVRQVSSLTKGEFVLVAPKEYLYSIAYGYFCARYTYRRSKTAGESYVLFFEGEEEASDKEKIHELLAVMDAFFHHKEMIVMPSSSLTPESAVFHLQQMCSTSRISLKQLDYRAMCAKGMGCATAVGRGSKNLPVTCILSMNEHLSTKPLVLVGKGVTFDSGGVCLKPSQGIVDMNQDMAGASLVVCLMRLVSMLKLPVKIVGYVCFAENMVDSTCYRTSDILTSVSKKTIEVLNTDAEGRLLLIDLFGLINNDFKHQDILGLFDFATLTGSIIEAFGLYCTGFHTSNEDFERTLFKVAYESGERVAKIPCSEAYRLALNSKVADIANITTKKIGAGSCTATAFLKEFVPERFLSKWIHFDIAGLISDFEQKDLRECSTLLLRTMLSFIRQSFVNKG